MGIIYIYWLILLCGINICTHIGNTVAVTGQKSHDMVCGKELCAP